MSKAAIAITSYNDKFYEDGAKTGLFLTEALHPFEYFRLQGIEVDFVSETGKFGYDEHSLGEAFLNGDDLAIYQNPHSEFNVTIKNLKAASEVNASDYAIFFAAGGHGTVFDFPKADGLHKLAQQIWSNKGVVAAVCHGPVIFDNLYDTATGRPLIEGKKVTGFTDEGEVAMNVDGILKRDHLETVRDICVKNGGQYDQPPDMWGDYTTNDGRLVTGVNPASASSTAKKALAVSSLKGV
ncbi:hypothetical protein HYPBUDRAFT_152875 [Hyphopichia burtonii NRRL Y-1933]|uniref:D-lactate dehydratase n=2 Tax=Opisthokonta TaxID=33154 RepID=A0A1E4RHS7_9ASCO|nr:hypothetical protein HYPBUDRAFT_152875 [Hyphopichia burtonii NRRL Y-1933]ODV66819.1 hypothetical protein HYPBUDRAFT_152875 [Hyphopichia burtonii NRRL Y-1933]